MPTTLRCIAATKSPTDSRVRSLSTGIAKSCLAAALGGIVLGERADSGESRIKKGRANISSGGVPHFHQSATLPAGTFFERERASVCLVLLLVSPWVLLESFAATTSFVRQLTFLKLKLAGLI